MTDDPRAAAFEKLLTPEVLERALSDITTYPVYAHHIAVLRRHIVRALCAAPDSDCWQPIDHMPQYKRVLFTYPIGVGNWAEPCIIDWSIAYRHGYWMPLPAPPKETT